MKRKILILFVSIFLIFLQTISIFAYSTAQFTKSNTDAYKNQPLSSGDISFCLNPSSYQSVYGGGRSSGTMFTVLGACVAQGHLYGAFFNGPYSVGGIYRGVWNCRDGGCSASIILNPEMYKSEFLGKKEYDYIAIKGYIEGQGVQSGLFNSPYIYLINPSKSEINISIDSTLQKYVNTKPSFNIENGWNINSEGEDTKLFYELALQRVYLSRKGRNFSDKESLIKFLENGDFFDKLGFSKEQRSDSLDYILPKIGESNNYYLTILSDKSISKLSSLNITPKPNNIIRKYYAIYSTDLPVTTIGDIKYPNVIDVEGGFVVQENGEVYVDDNMVVIWEK